MCQPMTITGLREQPKKIITLSYSICIFIIVDMPFATRLLQFEPHVLTCHVLA